MYYNIQVLLNKEIGGVSMSNKYIITTEVTADLSKEVVESLNLKMIPMNFSLDDEEYTHNYDFSEMSPEEFYNHLEEGKISKTSQINPETYLNFFEPFAKEGYSIIHISFSSALSGCYNSSTIAMSMLKEDYPDCECISIDSLCASSGQGLLVYEAIQNQNKGMSFEENAKWIEDNKLNMAHWFMVTNLTYLQRGGRISATGAVVGNMLQIHPLLHVSNDGKLEMYKMERGKKKTIKRQLTLFEETLRDKENSTVIITHAENPEVATTLRDGMKEIYPTCNFIMCDMGPIIGSHTGKGTVTVHYFATQR